VADFVRRVRRVALHPLALDGQGGDDFPCLSGAYLRMLMTAGGTLLVRPEGSATMRSPLPDEVQFESLATRVRTFTIKSDRLYWPTALDALDRTGRRERAVVFGEAAASLGSGHRTQHTRGAGVRRWISHR
jgi:hypothetical protein